MLVSFDSQVLLQKHLFYVPNIATTMINVNKVTMFFVVWQILVVP
jgi:hypothetical protein